MIAKLLDKERWFQWAVYAILAIVTIIVIYPLYYMFIVSISSGQAVIQGHVKLWPEGIQLQAYQAVLRDPNIPHSYLNTIIYTTIGTLVNLAMTALCAYPLSRKDLYGRYMFTFIIIFTMFLDAGMVANFLVVKSLDLRNSMWALILPTAINVWYMIIMRTFFAQIPDEIEQAASIDGANDLVIFFRIILPLSKPVIATLLLFYAVWHWNSYFPALLYLDERKLYPLQLIVRNIVIGGDTASMQSSMNVGSDTAILEKNLKYAATFISILPILCVYPFVQKYFVKGAIVGSLKG